MESKSNQGPHGQDYNRELERNFNSEKDTEELV